MSDDQAPSVRKGAFNDHDGAGIGHDQRGHFVFRRVDGRESKVYTSTAAIGSCAACRAAGIFTESDRRGR